MIKTLTAILNETGLVQVIKWFVKLKYETDTRLFDPEALQMTTREVNEMIDKHKQTLI